MANVPKFKLNTGAEMPAVGKYRTCCQMGRSILTML